MSVRTKGQKPREKREYYAGGTEALHRLKRASVREENQSRVNWLEFLGPDNRVLSHGFKEKH